MKTKSKFGYGFWLMGLLSTFFLFLLISAVAQYYYGVVLFRISLENPTEAKLQFILLSLAVIIFVSILIYNSNIIEIDSESQTILFLNIITRNKTKILFAQIKGYVQTEQKDGYGNKYQVYYLVENKKFVLRISSFNYRNIDELKEGLESLKNLGKINFGIVESVKVLFKMDVYVE